jgi:BASS family bile acid:Na+ symporter
MGVPGPLLNVRYWIVVGIVLGFAIGPRENVNFSLLMIVVLMIQMSISMDGLEFSRKDFREHRKDVFISLLCCFVLNTGVTILVGLPFINSHPGVWYGWALFASIPCAIAVVVCAIYMKGDVKLALLSVTAIYMISLGLTPILSFILIGNAVSPFEILRYIVLFIAVPFGLSFLIKRLHLKSESKTISMNAMMMLLVLFAIAANREAFFKDPWLVLAVLGFATLRLVATTVIPWEWSRRAGSGRGRSVVYVSASAWKNTGLCITMAMVLLPGMQEAVLPSVISLLAENVWFMIMTAKADKIWSEEKFPSLAAST